MISCTDFMYFDFGLMTKFNFFGFRRGHILHTLVVHIGCTHWCANLVAHHQIGVSH
jgi:hypothetical protein